MTLDINQLVAIGARPERWSQAAEDLRREASNGALAVAQLVEEVTQCNLAFGVFLGVRCARRRSDLSAVFRAAVKAGDPSSAPVYLEAMLPRLGKGRTIHLLLHLMDDAPARVAYAMYWLPICVKLSSGDVEPIKAVTVLVERVRRWAGDNATLTEDQLVVILGDCDRVAAWLRTLG